MPNTKRYRELLENARKAAEFHREAYNAARPDRGNSYGHQVTMALPDGDNARVQHKKSLMQEVILRRRKDLREKVVS